MKIKSLINKIMRDKKKMINDLGYCILHLLYVLLLEKLYIPNRYIATKLSKYI